MRSIPAVRASKVVAMKRTLDPNLKHIGMVRYADHYHPTNEQSEKHIAELADQLKTLPEVLSQVPRDFKLTFARMAREHGFQVHYFEKGLGR